MQIASNTLYILAICVYKNVYMTIFITTQNHRVHTIPFDSFST